MYRFQRSGRNIHVTQSMKFSKVSSIVIVYRKGKRALNFENFMLHIAHTFHVTYYTFISYYKLTFENFIFHIAHTFHITCYKYISYSIHITHCILHTHVYEVFQYMVCCNKSLSLSISFTHTHALSLSLSHTHTHTLSRNRIYI